MPTVLDRFHPAVRAWFAARFGAPSRAQEIGWPSIAEATARSSHDVLLCAPTGSGKTLAAFMWAIDRLLGEAVGGALSDEVSVLYVSPLKALANDIRLNLEEPLGGIRASALELGLEPAPIRPALRTGDTPASERSAMLRRPPHILVTTPESLFILLTSPRFREKLARVRWVIVDELHAIAGNKRGAHLMVTLERLERMVRRVTGGRPVRIGLSATLNPIERLGAFLAGAEVAAEGVRAPRSVEVVRADERARQMDLEVMAPGPELGPLATHRHWDPMYDEVARLVREHRTTLIFTLSRRWAERVALNLQQRLGAAAVMAHHGSLARRERLEAEQRLKRGELKAIVATSSLELGIDVGAVDLVCQIDSPKSISAAIQRVGRSGHSLKATPKGRFLALTLDDLLECAACVRAIRAGRLDEVEIPSGCLDVAAQQIVAIAAEEEDVSEEDLLRIVGGAYNFSGLDRACLRHVLEGMATEPAHRVPGASPRIFYDRANGRVRPRRGGRMAAITSGGTIPESGNYDVVIQSEGRRIGDVEEDFAQESSRGDVFALGSMPWRILGISRGRLMVEPAPGMAPTLPFWQAEAAGRSWALSEEVCDLRREIARRLEREGEGSAAEFLRGECLLHESAARQAAGYVKRGVAALGAVPDERTVVVERFFDGLGGTQIVVHAPYGIRFNRGLGLAIRKRLCQRFDFEIQASAIDDACLLALNARHSFPLQDLFPMLPAKNARGALVQALLAAPMFEVRFRHVATRALAVMRSNKGRKVPAYLQRLRAQELLAAIFPGQQACFENRPPAIPLSDHFAIEETIRECLTESTNAERMESVLRGIEDGSIRVVTVDTVSPSVFAHRLLLAWDYAFLDDGERANRRSRTVQMNRGMAEQVFRTEDLSEMLSREVIETVVGEVSGRAPERRARNRDELYELIRAHGGLSQSAIAERVRDAAASMVKTLEDERRVTWIRPSPEIGEIVVASDDAGLWHAAYQREANGTAAPVATGEGELDAHAARTELVRRTLSTSGPLTLEQIVRRLWISEAEAGAAVSALEARGAIFRGHFTSAAIVQWCDRHVLERIHRLTLARVRAEIEPCEDFEYAAFLLKWHRVDGEGGDARAALAAALEQLSGVPFVPAVWERLILPARVPGYRPEQLDLACMSGEFTWVAPPHDGADLTAPLRVALVTRRELPLFVRDSAGQPDEPKERAVWRALAEGGAQYLDQLAERANVSERDALAALWRLAAAGRVSNDSFAPLRLLAASAEGAEAVQPKPVRSAGRHEAAVRARLKSSFSGRWSALSARESGAAGQPDRERELAMVLLRRHGILAREMMAVETIEMPWSEIVFALRRLEYAGAVRRGWFVRSLSGEQYALPEAVEMLRAVRGATPESGRVVALSAADPANPWGGALKGCGIAREAQNLIVIRGGRILLGLPGRALLTFGSPGDKEFTAAVGALARMREKIMIETIDGVPALESERVAALAAAQFHSDGRALVYDGLPGPIPLKARAQREARP